VDDIAAANARLEEIAREAKSIMLAAIKAGRQATPADRARLDALLHEQAQIERTGN
jgi:hypothetical protein